MASNMKRASARIRLLLAEDEPVVLRGLAALFEQQPDIELVGEAADGAQAARAAKIRTARRRAARHQDAQARRYRMRARYRRGIGRRRES